MQVQQLCNNVFTVTYIMMFITSIHVTDRDSKVTFLCDEKYVLWNKYLSNVKFRTTKVSQGQR